MSNLQLTFVDVEALWDEELYNAYRVVDPRGAAKIEREERHLHRLPCKRIVAAAALDIEISDAGSISISSLNAWTEHEYGGEKEVVTQLFEHLRGKPQTHVVTYGGLGHVRQCGVISGMAIGRHFQAALGVICSG